MGTILMLFGFFGLFVDFGAGLALLIIGFPIAMIEEGIFDDIKKRHENDYGKAPTCYKCGSSRTYFMTYDDKRASINFWGAASSKIGKRYHCDNCGNEW